MSPLRANALVRALNVGGQHGYRNQNLRIAPLRDHHVARVMGGDEGVITRNSLIAFGGLAGAAAATAAAWPVAGPTLAIVIGIFAGLGAMAALHELLPKHW